ncbi:hypothetical protein GCK32_001030 [Trichostrongylus colubriformis]|uniref:Uncharacterized protein n=1 Tax=Trichostrongylus colubriformis TaxID=6319 RepID=A0AAN8J179_TRICO
MESTMSTMSSKTSYLFTLNTDPEAVTIGTIYATLAFFMIPLYCVFNWVMWTDPDIKNMPMYRLMNHINLIDFCQLLCHFISGFFAIYPEIIHRSRFFSSFVGSTVNSLWQAMFPYLFVLSVSRILIIKKKMASDKLILPLCIILIVGWVFTIIVWLWSWFGMAFVFGKIGWEYDFSMWSSPYLKFIELGWCVPTILVSYIIYVGIIIHLVLNKRQLGSKQSHRKEILIFCQATFLNGWMLGLMTTWHGSTLLGLTKNYHQCIINCVWILFSYLNPLLLIVLNPTVRKKVLLRIVPIRLFTTMTIHGSTKTNEITLKLGWPRARPYYTPMIVHGKYERMPHVGATYWSITHTYYLKVVRQDASRQMLYSLVEDVASAQSSQMSDLFALNTDPEAVLIGIIYASLAFFMIPFYCVFNWVMWTDSEIKKMSMYRLMNHINLIDFCQLLCHFVSGFFAIYPEIIHRSRFFSSFVGSTVNSLWQAMFPYLFVLSVSRILIIKKKMSPDRLTLPLSAVLIVGWVFTVTVWLWSWLGMAFVFGKIGWEYDFTMWSSPYLKYIELGWCVPTILVSYIMYVAIIIHLVSSRRMLSSNYSYREEILIFCQATFLNGWMLGLMTTWHGSALFGLTKNYHQCVINCAWILFSYLNPILLIVLNKTIRRKMLQFVCSRQLLRKMSIHSSVKINDKQAQIRIVRLGQEQQKVGDSVHRLASSTTGHSSWQT